MLGGAVVVGFLGGRLLSGARRRWEGRRQRREAAAGFSRAGGAAHAPAPAFTPAPAAERAPEPPAEEKPSWLGRVGSTFGDELNTLKGLALGATFGVLRDMLTSAVPDQLKPQLADVMNGLTTKLGGKVFQGPLVDAGEHGG